MIAQTLAVLLLLAQSTALTPGPAAPPPPTAEPTQEQVFAEIDAAMAAWKGKKGDRLHGRLGLSSSTQRANNGNVVFWERRLDSTACGVDDSGQMRCGAIDGLICRFGVALDQQGIVLEWKAMGNAEACQMILRDIGQP